MDERKCLIKEIGQCLREIADTIDQNQLNSSSFQYFFTLIYSLMYSYNFYFNCK